MSYMPLSRRFRPQFFSDIIGQESVVTTLKNALRLGRTASAYLFTGTRGIGKTTLARVFAKTLNCKNLDQSTFESCNNCSSCQEIALGHSLDVIEIDGASNRGIDDIRQINETVHYTSSGGGYKIYIIDEVHMLTKEAFNALLKTLEEPPEKVKFFLATTEPHKVLPTIISRCQRFDLRRIAESFIIEKLKTIAIDLGRNVEEKALLRIALFAEGSLRDAESLFEQVLCYEENIITEETIEKALGLVPNSLLFSLDQAFSEGNLSFAITLAEKLYQDGKDFGTFLDQLSEHYRNILAYKQNHTKDLKSYEGSLQIYTQSECLIILELILQTMQSMQKSSLKKVHLEMLLLKLLQIKKSVTVEEVILRLLELEKKIAISPLEKEEVPQKNVEKRDIEKITQCDSEIKQDHSVSRQNEEVVVNSAKEDVSLQAIPFSLQPLQKQENLPVGNIHLSTKVPNLENVAILQKVMTSDNLTHNSAADVKKNARYETLMRFAAVELEGSLKKGDYHG